MLQIDLVGKKAKNWYDEGSIPSEPFFVARPGATEEDDGKGNACIKMMYIIKCVYRTAISTFRLSTFVTFPLNTVPDYHFFHY